MANDNCINCDRPKATHEQWLAVPTGQLIEGVCLAGHAYPRQEEDCLLHAVDWRERALTALARVARLEGIARDASGRLYAERQRCASWRRMEGMCLHCKRHRDVEFAIDAALAPTPAQGSTAKEQE